MGVNYSYLQQILVKQNLSGREFANTKVASDHIGEIPGEAT